MSMNTRRSKSARVPRLKCRACRELAGNEGFGAHVLAGKRALAKMHNPLIRVRLDCSVNIEEALSRTRRQGEKIFDYLVVLTDGCQSRFIEVHPASSTSQVKEVIAKKHGTESALSRTGIKTPESRWQWLVHGEGTVAFNANSRYGKMLALEGIRQPKRSMES